MSGAARHAERALTGAAALYLGVAGVLLVCALLPAAVGWRGNLLISDSMAPSLPAGSILVSSAPGSWTAAPGDVVVVRDPAAPGGRLAHRVVGRDARGHLMLRGDANGSVDARRVADGEVVGRMRFGVPWVGRPLVWMRDGTFVPLLGWFALTSGAILLVGRRAGGGAGGATVGPVGAQSAATSSGA